MVPFKVVSILKDSADFFWPTLLRSYLYVGLHALQQTCIDIFENMYYLRLSGRRDKATSIVILYSNSLFAIHCIILGLIFHSHLKYNSQLGYRNQYNVQ